MLYRAPPSADAEAPLLKARRDLVALAERKRVGGGALLAAGQPAEALGLFHEAMALACRALDPRGDPGSELAARLAAIHGHLVPGCDGERVTRRDNKSRRRSTGGRNQVTSALARGDVALKR